MGDGVQGNLDLLLLAALQGGPLHGYGIVDDVRRRSHGSFELTEGAVYPALHRLEDEGWVSGSWTVVGGRRRRVYRLTRSGRSKLGERRREWKSFAVAMNAVLEAQ